ncbi:MAG: hypothetical protein ACP5IE_01340 [Infirmifilum sp.]
MDKIEISFEKGYFEVYLEDRFLGFFLYDTPGFRDVVDFVKEHCGEGESRCEIPATSDAVSFLSQVENRYYYAFPGEPVFTVVARGVPRVENIRYWELSVNGSRWRAEEIPMVQGKPVLYLDKFDAIGPFHGVHDAVIYENVDILVLSGDPSRARHFRIIGPEGREEKAIKHVFRCLGSDNYIVLIDEIKDDVYFDEHNDVYLSRYEVIAVPKIPLEEARRRLQEYTAVVSGV